MTESGHTQFEATLLTRGWEHKGFNVSFNSLDDVSTISSHISRQISSKLKEYEDEGYLINRAELKKQGGGIHHLMELPCVIIDAYKRNVYYRIITRKLSEAEIATAQIEYFIANLDESLYQDPVKMIRLLTAELDRVLNQQ